MTQAETSTAIVYFHGIGNQRRHQEISRLIDALDRVAFLEEDALGRLEKIQGDYETARVEDRPDVPFVSAQHRQVVDNRHLTATIRFYEGYWAPLNKKTFTLRQLFTWSARHVGSSLWPIGRHWRAEPRLRRRALHQLADLDDSPADWKSTRRLLEAYDDFERPHLHRVKPDGTFEDFVATLPPGDDDRALAERWRREFIAHRLTSFAILSSILLAVLVVGFAFVFGSLQFLELITEWGIASSLGDAYEPSWRNATTFAGVLVVFVGIAGMASKLLGDVVAWAAYRETDPRYDVRAEILQNAVDTLRHVLLNDSIERVVVIGHSLGTAIAYDALLVVGRQHRAAGEAGADRVGDLGKLDQLITLGSPIDLLFALAESHRGKYHRYVRLEEAFRGDIGSAPFSPVDEPRKPHMHWINMWDRYDPIATPIYSPNDKRAQAVRVDNVCVKGTIFPDPAASHSSYFGNRDVVEQIFRIGVLGESSFRNQRPVLIGNGSPKRRVGVAQIAMLALPWLVAAAIAVRALNAPPLVTNVSVAVAAAMSMLIMVGMLVARIVGVRPGLGPPASPANSEPADSPND